ncbi:MAG: GAF domain-containing protein [Thermomicrobiales bacterium]
MSATMSNASATDHAPEQPLLSLVLRLGAAATLPDVLATLAEWPALFGAPGVALYLPGARSSAGAVGLAPETLLALDAALAQQLDGATEPHRAEASAPSAIGSPVPLRRDETAWLLPMIAGEQPRGVVALVGRTTAPDEREREQWLHALAQIGAALSRVDALRAAQQEVHAARMLVEMRHAFARLTVEQAVARVAELCPGVLGDGCWIALRDDADPTSTARILAAHHRLLEQDQQLARLRGDIVQPGAGLAGSVLASGVVAAGPPPDSSADAPDDDAALAWRDVRSCICVPLRTQETAPIHGVLVCLITEPGSRLTAAEVALAWQVAHLIADGVETARLQQVVRERERETQLLAGAEQLFGVTRTAAEILPRIAESIVEELADLALVYEWETDSGQPQLVTSAFASPELGARWRDQSRRGQQHWHRLLDAAMRANEPLLVSDTRKSTVSQPAWVAALDVQSWLVMPLQDSSGPFAMLSVSVCAASQRAPLDRAALRLITTLARRTVAALENARLHEQAERRERETTLLSEINSLFNSSADLPQTLTTMTELIGQALGDSCVLFLTQPERKELLLSACWHQHPDERESRRAALADSPPIRGKGPIGMVADGGPAVLIRDFHQTLGAKSGAARVDQAGMRSWLCAPLREGRNVLGVLTLGLAAPARRLDERDLALVEAITERAAVAIRQQHLAAEQRRAELLQSTIAALAREVGGTLEPGDVAGRLAEALRRHFAYSSVGVYLTDDDRREVLLRGTVAQNDESGAPRSVRLPFGSGIVGWVAEQGEAVMIPDVTVDPRFGRHALASRAAPIRAQLSVPIPGDDGPLGVIDLTSERVGAFTADDLYIVRSVARQAAVAIENAQLHERLAESAATFQDLVERAPDPFFILSLAGQFAVVNEAMCELAGYDADQLHERQFVDLLAPEERERGLALLRQAGRETRGGTQEWTVLRADGGRRIIEIRTRVLSERGQPIGVQGVGRDVTMRREQQLALERQVMELSTLHAAGLALADTLEPQELYQALLGAIRAAISCDDATLYTLDDESRMQLGATLHPAAELPPAFPSGHHLIDWSLQQGQSLLFNDAPSEPLYRPVPGLPAPRHLLIVPLLAVGQVRGSIVLRRMEGDPFTLNDLRLIESIAAQAAVTLHNVRLHAETSGAAADLRVVLESIEQGVVMTDHTGRIRLANRRRGELLTLNVRDLVGRTVLEVAEEGIMQRTRDPRAFYSRLRWLQAHPDDIATDEITLSRPASRVLERYSGPMRDPVTEVTVGRIEVYTDVTEARRLERAKDEFLATASHELKTPITTLGGYLELLGRQAEQPAGPDLARLNRYIVTARGELARLLRLSEDLLEVARIEAGRLTLQLKLGDLAATIRETVEHLGRQQNGRLRGHRLLCQFEAPLTAVFDALRIGQVLNNLLENALKYSPAGTEIHIEAASTAGEAVVGVRDEGIGVPPEEREKLFQPFYRARNASDGSPEGLGLGLYISRGIIEGHGGRMWVESAPGGGSIFRVALPMLESRSPADSAESLVVEGYSGPE